MQIRIASLDDAEELLKIYAPYVEKTAITFEYEVPTLEEFKNRMTRVLERYPYLVAEKEGELLGYAYVSPFKERPAYNCAVENSIYVKEGCRRLGVGRRLYEELERILKLQNILNMEACIACPQGEKDEYLTWHSVRFHERMGYRLVGEFQQCGYKFHHWYNMVWMEKQIGAHIKDQPEIIKFGKIEYGKF